MLKGEELFVCYGWFDEVLHSSWNDGQETEEEGEMMIFDHHHFFCFASNSGQQES